MSFLARREAARQNDQNVSRHDFSWEEQNVPLLHSGFTEPNPHRSEYGILYLSVWFKDGGYRIRLQDRSSDEKAFLEVGTLGALFSEIEHALDTESMSWSADRASRNGNFGT